MLEKLKRVATPVGLGFVALSTVLLLVAAGAIASFLYVRSTVQAFNAGMDRIVDESGIDVKELVNSAASLRTVDHHSGTGPDQSSTSLSPRRPGSAVSDVSYVFQRPWEDFSRSAVGSSVASVVRRSTGTSCAAPWNREQVISDGTIELVEYLRKRFRQQR